MQKFHNFSANYFNFRSGFTVALRNQNKWFFGISRFQKHFIMIPKKQSYLTSEKQVQKKTPRRNISKLLVFPGLSMRDLNYTQNNLDCSCINLTFSFSFQLLVGVLYHLKLAFYVQKLKRIYIWSRTDLFQVDFRHNMLLY